jgi:hypothetical protein
MQASKITNYTVNATTTASEKKFTGIEPFEVKVITVGADVHVLFTSETSTTKATVNDFLLPQNSVVSFLVSRGLNRMSIITEGSSSKVYLAALS